MGCLPQGGCERRITEPFVTQLNNTEHRQYLYQTCLDKGRSGRQAPQPEILYSEPTTGERLVIEVKHLTWPRRYAQRHNTDHELAELIGERLRATVASAPYELRLPHLFRGKPAQVEAFAASIENGILAGIDFVNSGKAIGSRVPGREWSFRLQSPQEREEGEPPTGIHFVWFLPNGLDPDLRARARRELAPELQKHFQACIRKFSGYKDARRILLVSLVGDAEFDSADWVELLQAVPVPDAVTEIWQADNTWITPWDRDWEFSRIYPPDTSESEIDI